MKQAQVSVIRSQKLTAAGGGGGGSPTDTSLAANIRNGFRLDLLTIWRFWIGGILLESKGWDVDLEEGRERRVGEWIRRGILVVLEAMGAAAGTICEGKNGEMGVYLHFEWMVCGFYRFWLKNLIPICNFNGSTESVKNPAEPPAWGVIDI